MARKNTKIRKVVEAYVNIYQTDSGFYVTGMSLYKTYKGAKENRNDDYICPDSDLRYIRPKKIKFVDYI